MFNFITLVKKPDHMPACIVVVCNGVVWIAMYVYIQGTIAIFADLQYSTPCIQSFQM